MSPRRSFIFYHGFQHLSTPPLLTNLDAYGNLRTWRFKASLREIFSTVPLNLGASQRRESLGPAWQVNLVTCGPLVIPSSHACR